MGMRKILVTGAAGFIGFHLAQRFLNAGDTVVGIDNLNDYYDVSLKESRLARLEDHRRFRFIRMDLADREGIAHHGPLRLAVKTQDFAQVVDQAD